MQSLIEWLLNWRNPKTVGATHAEFASSSPSGTIDLLNEGFPLVPDDYHLQDVGKTSQGNGFWITQQLSFEDGVTHDFIAAYVFDKAGNLIFCEIVDQGKRDQLGPRSSKEVILNLRRKIDAKETEEIRVKPFSTSFYGHTFGLIVRAPESELDDNEILVDAMPGFTLMFHGPWGQCNYAS